MEKQHLLAPEYENLSWLIEDTIERRLSLSFSLFASFPSNPRTKAWKALKSLSLSPSSVEEKRDDRERRPRVKVVFDSSWIETCLTWACDTQPNAQGRYAPFPCSNYNNIWPRKIKFFHIIKEQGFICGERGGGGGGCFLPYFLNWYSTTDGRVNGIN